MKKRLNILCLMVFVVMAIGILPFAYAMGVGFQAGTSGDYQENDVPEIEQVVNAESVHLMPARLEGLTMGSIHNEVTGQEVSIWPERVMVNMPIDYPGWFTVMNTVTQWLVYVVLIVIMVLFLKIIVRVNKGRVFEWKNVRLLRWLGGIVLGSSILTTVLQIYGASIIGQQFAVKGFAPDYFSYISVMELTVGLVALIVAEIFAVGLKMKEEQDLTI